MNRQIAGCVFFIIRTTFLLGAYSECRPPQVNGSCAVFCLLVKRPRTAERFYVFWSNEPPDDTMKAGPVPAVCKHPTLYGDHVESDAGINETPDGT